jgi:hypothetical protein
MKTPHVWVVESKRGYCSAHALRSDAAAMRDTMREATGDEYHVAKYVRVEAGRKKK